MNAFLYTNRQGRPITIHSHSAGNEFKTCRRKYALKRIHGWKEKKKNASREFGNCIESAIKFYHDSGKRTGVAAIEFARQWRFFEKDETLTYTDRDGSWADLLQTGIELMELYELVEPTLPLGKQPRFQLNYRKELFAGTELAGVEYTAYVDVTTEEPRIVDIKTAANPLPDILGIATLDPQLREYAWISGIQNVAWLWLVKAKASAFQKGDNATVLRIENSQADHSWEGKIGVVLFADEEFVYIAEPAVYEQYSQEVKGVKGKALDAKKAAWAEREDVRGFSPNLLTKQRIQFVTGRIPDEDLTEIGNEIARVVSEIVRANEESSWPKIPGVRFPSNHCLICPFLGNCTENKELRDTLVERTDEDWLDKLEDE